MAKIYLTRRETFSAAHKLYEGTCSAAQNEEMYGKCTNIHGHNYVLEVTIVGDVHPITGCVVDLKKLKEIILKEIIHKVDHTYLNEDVDFLRGLNPTSENLVQAFWHRIVDKIPSGKLYSLKLFETEKNIVEYRGEQ